MLEKVKAGINKGILSASVNSGTYLEVEKLKGKIANEQKENVNALNELGRITFECWKAENLDISEVNLYCQEIENRNVNIDTYQKEIERLEVEKAKILGKDRAAVLPQIMCRKCGASTPAGGKFCLQCGEELIYEEDEQNDEMKICSCGNRCKDTDKFCMKCGKTL